MENASKALLMAAGVLIGMLVISLAVYLFVSFGMASAQIHKEQEQKQLEQFNTQFFSYESKEENTIYDVVTVANLATENNIYYQLEKRTGKQNGKDNYISVRLDNSNLSVANRGFIEKGYLYKGQIDYDKIIQEELENGLEAYQCKVSISRNDE